MGSSFSAWILELLLCKEGAFRGHIIANPISDSCGIPLVIIGPIPSASPDVPVTHR